MLSTSTARYSTLISSLILRLVSYGFLRWIPGHPVPPLVVALLVIYVPSFIYSFAQTTPYEVVADEVDVITTAVVDTDDALNALDPRYVDKDIIQDVGEEITVQETIIVEPGNAEAVKTLLTGLPSPSSIPLSLATFAINLLLATMVFDYTYRATWLHPAHDLSFARLGYVSDTTANILIREPDVKHLPIFASYRLADGHVEGAWKSGGSISILDNSTDFTGRFLFTGLEADTRYQYTTSTNHSGDFITSPRDGQLSSRVGRKGSFTFLHSSCLKNNFPYSPLAHPLSNKGLRYLGKILHKVEAQFMIFLGDFIYVDVPRRHGSSIEDYRREYRQVYASPDWPIAAKSLPWVHVWDDHELANDHDKNTTGFYPSAVEPYKLYHTMVNPPLVRQGEAYFQWVSGPASFFMLDTRRYRSPNDRTNGTDPITGLPTKTMLGEQQLKDLLAWLRRTESPGVRWKFVITSVPFTMNWVVGDSAQDTWRGYLGERQIILEAMWDVGVKGIGVVILSGDRHEFAATAFPPPPDGKEVPSALAAAAQVVHKVAGAIKPGSEVGKSLQTARKRWPASAVVHEFSASPLQMFYLPIRTYKESSTSSEYVSDVCIKYIPEGNSKLGAVSLSSTSDQSILHYTLYVDGEERWSHTITTPPQDGREFRNQAIWG